MDRRDFLNRSFWLASGAGALASGWLTKVSAQNQNLPVKKHGRYDDSLIFERKRTFSWPNGKTLAIWIIPNVEVFTFDSAGGGGIGSPASAPPDVKNFAWREYGMRIGLWRIADVMAAAGVRATVALNSGVCEVFPKAVEQMQKLGWEFMGHGVTNSQSLSKLSLDQETAVIQKTLKTIEQFTGKRPKGWLGPGLNETYNTPDILADQGVEYVGDWNSDDQPIPMKVKTGKLVSIPYCMELNDIGLYERHAYTGEQYLRIITDQFDTLYADSQKLPRVMGIPIHPYLTGQPLRIKYFKQAIANFQKQDGVWFATGSEILRAFQSA